MRTLIYKRTHSGDTNPETGEFGNHNCMGQVRSWDFDAVIGVGGIGQRAKFNGIAKKLTWIGIGPRKTGDSSRPRVTFDHFLYHGETGPLLETAAPVLARRIFGGNVRIILDGSLSTTARREVGKILGRARAAPPSPGRLQGGRRRNIRPKRRDNCR